MRFNSKRLKTFDLAVILYRQPIIEERPVDKVATTLHQLAFNRERDSLLSRGKYAPCTIGITITHSRYRNYVSYTERVIVQQRKVRASSVTRNCDVERVIRFKARAFLQ